MQKRIRTNKNIEYSSLEPRMMLAGDIEAGRSLVVNGDLQDTESIAFFALVDGEETAAAEVATRAFGSNFGNAIELDTAAGQVDSVAQDLVTEVGDQYIISFDLRDRNFDFGSEVEVLFGGESVGTFEALSRWQTLSVTVTADSELSRLEFREVSQNSDGAGLFIDNVAVAAVRGSEVVNGSFENVADGATGVLPATSVPGFSAINPDGTPELSILSGDAADGNNFLNLNTSDSTVDRIFQSVATEVGGLYYLSFELRDGGDSTNQLPPDVRVRIDGDFAGSFQATSEFQQVGLVLTADSDLSTIVFREGANSPGDGLDVQIDNIQLLRLNSVQSDFSLDLNSAVDGTDNSIDIAENAQGALAADSDVGFGNGSILSSATARVIDFTGSETLSAVTTGTNIEASFNNTTGILRLVGRDSVENFNQVLQSLTYVDSDNNPTNLLREVVVSVTDGTAISARETALVNVTVVNDAPIISNIDNLDLAEDTPATISVNAFDPDNDDAGITYDIEVSGDTFIFDELPTISADGEISLEAADFGDAVLTVIAEDINGARRELSFDVNVAFEAPTGDIPADFVPFSGERQLSDTLPALREGIYDEAPEFNIDTSLNYEAIFETADGEIRVELFAAESPNTVNNFINFAEDGFFDGITFHRVIENFVAQGGDPSGTGFGGPGFEFADELDNGLEFNGFGQLAMANSGPDTNGSQFFFTLNDNPAFAGEHTIFGQVIEGDSALLDVAITDGVNTPTVIERVRIVTV